MKKRKVIIAIVTVVIILAVTWFGFLYFEDYFKKEKIYTSAFPKEKVTIENNLSDYSHILQNNWKADAPSKKVREYRMYNYWILGNNEDLIFSTEWYNHILTKPDFVYPELKAENISKIVISEYFLSGDYENDLFNNWTKNNKIYDLNFSEKQKSLLYYAIFDDLYEDAVNISNINFSDNNKFYTFKLYFNDIKGLYYEDDNIKISCDNNNDFWILYGYVSGHGYIAKKLPDDLNKLFIQTVKITGSD